MQMYVQVIFALKKLFAFGLYRSLWGGLPGCRFLPFECYYPRFSLFYASDHRLHLAVKERIFPFGAEGINLSPEFREVSLYLCLQLEYLEPLFPFLGEFLCLCPHNNSAFFDNTNPFLDSLLNI